MIIYTGWNRTGITKFWKTIKRIQMRNYKLRTVVRTPQKSENGECALEFFVCLLNSNRNLHRAINRWPMYIERSTLLNIRTVLFIYDTVFFI